jgi:flagellar hook protein FlgE
MEVEIMLKSMYAAVTGLKSFQTKMDVIGNNIANVNTVGFKSSSVVFKDLYYQTLASASAPTATKGGINAMQVGMGTSGASTDVSTTRSGMMQTDSPLDMYIAGDGYFAVQEGSGAVDYTRVGSFKFDVQGNLVDSSGNLVCGLNADSSGAIPAPVIDPATGSFPISPISIPKDAATGSPIEYSNISIGKDGTITGLNPTTGAIDTFAQVTVSKFANPDALLQNGNLNSAVSANSGSAVNKMPNSTGTAPLVSGGLEMSNVDLSKEFTDMIISQRGLQANARVITTSDEILQELVALKR